MDVIDGQPDGDGLFANALLTDFSKQGIGAEIEPAATFSDGHHPSPEEIAAL